MIAREKFLHFSLINEGNRSTDDHAQNFIS